MLSPADGRVLVAGPRGRRRRRRRATWQQISIFLSPMDVHVNRVPVVGTRHAACSYTPGRFLPAYRHDAGDLNERSEIWIDHGGQTVVARQIVGILARRVVCRVQAGDDGAGRRPVRRHEVRIADGHVPAADRRRSRVQVGEKVRGGETVIAVLH